MKPTKADTNKANWKAIYDQIPAWKKFKPMSKSKPRIPKGIQPHQAPDLSDFQPYANAYDPLLARSPKPRK